MTDLELTLLLTVVIITQYSIHGISAIGTMVEWMDIIDLLFIVII